MDLLDDLEAKLAKRSCSLVHGERRNDIGDCLVYLETINLGERGVDGVHEGVELIEVWREMLWIQ